MRKEIMELSHKNLAAIDIGTNSFHLIVVSVKEDGNFEIIDREKEVIRLGEGSAGDIKIIKPEAFNRAFGALKRFKEIADSHNASIRALATSAVREAHNKNDFMEQVFKECGINIELISGIEEARLIYLGILKAVPVFDKKILAVDIGGGSTEFLVGKKGEPIFSVSMKIGAVRLTQKFFPDFHVNKSRIQNCRDWIEGELFQTANTIKNKNYQLCVGSSGTIMSAGLMINALKNNSSGNGILNNFVFTKEELDEIEEEVLSRKTVEKRKKIPGIDDKRAEIIPAGILILSTIFRLFKLDKITISGYALREGIIIDTLQKHHSDLSKPGFEDIRRESISYLSKSFRNDISHGKHVAKLSLQLFDQTKDLHKLNEECREYLEAAAILHDVGYHISHANHHRHSYYIIRNSELLGFNDNEINIIAHTARYHRKSHPKSGHHEFKALPAEIQSIIKKLSALLRIADSFDRTHRKLVSGIGTIIKNKNVEILLQYNSKIKPDIELWNLERRKGLFEEVFDKKIIIKA
jgi:exopolyphosphatase / guanosine-5'-triphosphate,3'-diphosphate pyrophosphatase